MTNVFERLGAATLINAYGPMTRFGGGIMGEEVAAAMREATQYCVDMPALQAAASRIIADVTGAEAGIVTSGASAGLLLGTAACVTGLDAAKMNRLPDLTGMKNEIVVMRGQRNSYDRALRAVGVTLVEVGVSDRANGTGIRDADLSEIREAVGERTAAIFYLAKPQALPRLTEVASLAHELGVPVLVDAAAELPPLANLKRFIAEGADLVAFSGGKMIGGPQGSGLLCGRRDLVAAALLQQLDLDYTYDEWNPPPALIDKQRLQGVPRHGVGRSCKTGKEQIVGLLTALQVFARESDRDREARWQTLAERLAGLLQGLSSPSLAARVIADPDGSGIPVVELRLGSARRHVNGREVLHGLRSGSPRIEVNPWRPEEGLLILSPACLREDDVPAIAKRFGEILGAS
ncbi:putative transferase [Hypericibacter adhaerens]|uniref:Putative transferase n=1 Tax=Hypericibacter adhaerens TaxID=2602016 RepID=A0A5J6MYX9_9PROT|nr:aminotransferase class V-fold PLP-dependent enzyme [Hypericibacter adhaerens]QEX22521.1 putative transferase [Hypericibacter adhaerens]HVY52087.1 aminotransferase class V-fold PLP-dependent enzyme [Devosia sp.]